MTERSDTSSPAAGQDSPAGTHNALAGRTAADAEEASIALFAARRTELGLSHEDVANQLKFAPRLIEALEAGEFDKLPGRTFARGMLRNYAKLLKIDPAPYLAQLTAASGPQAGPEHAASLRAPIPFAEGGSHVNLVYTVLSAIILAAVAFFAYEWYQEKDAPPKMAFVAPGQEPSATQAPAQVNPPTAEPRLDTFASAGPAPVPDTEPRVEVKNPMASSAANPAMNPAANPAVSPHHSPAAPCLKVKASSAPSGMPTAQKLSACRMAGTRVSPAPRRMLELITCVPSNTWKTAAMGMSVAASANVAASRV